MLQRQIPRGILERVQVSRFAKLLLAYLLVVTYNNGLIELLYRFNISIEINKDQKNTENIPTYW